MATIHNPILTGFNPDPSILRVGDDYYIATSTFEWFPGVQIHHSRDLVNWRLLCHPLNRVEQLDMRQNPTSGGIWAPCLSYCDGLFYLIYTDVKSHTGPFKDTHNYLVTCDTIDGRWSDPIYMNSSGFDPSLFHDEDGRKWFVNMRWDHHRKGKYFGGILLQEYDPKQKKLVGEIYKIFDGSGLGLEEGPHLLKKDGWYYLIVAEGGTLYEHAVTVARSRNITGPYELHPQNPIITSFGDDSLPLQKAGHASFVQTQTGEWYMAHLCGRPLPGTHRCTLGRETSLQKITWREDGWPLLAQGGYRPALNVEGPDLPLHPFPAPEKKVVFSGQDLPLDFAVPRVPFDRVGRIENNQLILRGRETLGSRNVLSLVARRWQHFKFTAETCLHFEPQIMQQLAGLICFYDVENYYYLYISREDDGRKVIGLLSNINNVFAYPLGREGVTIPEGAVYLRVEVDYGALKFSYSMDGKIWTPIGPIFDASTLADESCREGRFTGSFVGMTCQDPEQNIEAVFDYFIYDPE